MLLRPILAFAALIAIPCAALAQASCPHEESDREAIAKSIQATGACKASYDLLNACRSNTSGDVALAEIVIEKCEAGFLSGMTAAGKRSYAQEREACQRKYAKRQGTMYVSFSATCAAGVAVKFAGSGGRK